MANRFGASHTRTAYKEPALSQLAAQHGEILRLRQPANSPNNVRNLPTVR